MTHSPAAQVRARIRGLEIEIDAPDAFVPADPEKFSCWLRMIFGPSDGPGEEFLDFTVCTPRWLAEQVTLNGPMNGRHHIIVNQFHWPTLRAYLEELVATTWGADHAEVATRLSRYGRYEFEDYSETPAR